MSYDAWAVVDCLFNTIWTLFTGWHIPGTTITPASAFAFLLCAGIGLRFMGRILGESISIEDGYSAYSNYKGNLNRREYTRANRSIAIRSDIMKARKANK